MDNLPKEPDLTDHDNKREMWNTYSPIALFASTRNFITKRNHLVPVAIQMDFTQGLVYLSIDIVGMQLSNKILLVAAHP